MSLAPHPEEIPAVSVLSAQRDAAPASRRRPLSRRVMHWIRRTHLYVGLFLFPWAILYGVTGFLFNHPSVWPDTLAIPLTRADIAGTPLEHCPSPAAQAAALLTALNQKQPESPPFRSGPGAARYAAREGFVATVKADQRKFFVVFDPLTATGMIRESTPSKPVEPAPFATNKPAAPQPSATAAVSSVKDRTPGIQIADSVTDRLKSAIPDLMRLKGFTVDEVTLTSAPDLKFPIEAEGKLWTATFNPITHSLTGVPGTGRGELTARMFLLRMHLTRGYPGEINTKWLWAMGVDAIALTLCFWGVSGLCMWWQIKATRIPGLIVLAASTLTATLLGLGMHRFLTS